MGTKKTIIELTTTGGEQVRVDLEKIGEEGQRSLQRILDATKPANEGLKVIDETVGELRGKFNEFASELGPLGNVLKSLGPAGLIAAGAAGGVLALTHAAIENAAAMGEAADRVGLHVQTLQELQFAARQTGVDQEKLSSSLGTFTTRVGEARGGSLDLLNALNKESVAAGDASKATQQHNRELFEAVRNAGSADEAFDIYAKAIANAGSETDKAALAAAGFGKAGRQVMLPFLKDGVEGLEQLRQKAHDMGLVLSDETIKSAREAADKLAVLADVIKINLTNAVINLAPYLAAAAEALADLTAAGAALLGGSLVDPAKAAAAKNDLAGVAVAIDETKKRLDDLNKAYADPAQRASLGDDFIEKEADKAVRKLEFLESERKRILDARDLRGEEAPAKPKLAPLETGEEKAAREKYLSDRKAAVAYIQSLDDQAAKEGQTKRAAALAQEAADYQKIADFEKANALSGEEADKARLDAKETAEKKLTAITEEEEKKRAEARQGAEKIVGDTERQITLLGLNESERRQQQFEYETEDLLQQLQTRLEASGATEEEITAKLAQEREARKQQYGLQVADAKKASEGIKIEFSGAISEIATGILRGERDWKQGWRILEDLGIGTFGKILSHKLEQFDPQMRSNFITDLPGFVSEGASAIGSIFSGLFGSILSGKGEVDKAFSSGFGGGGNGTGPNLAGQVLAGGTNIVGSALGSAGTSALGNLNLLGSVLGPGGGGIVGPEAALTSQEAALLFPKGNVPANFAVSPALSQQLATTLSNAVVSGVFGFGGGLIGSKIGAALGGKTGGQVGGVLFGLLAAKFGPTLAGTIISTYAPSLAAELATTVPTISASLGIGAAGGATAGGAAAGGAAGGGAAAGGAAGGLSSTGIGAIVAAGVLAAIQSGSQVQATFEGKQSPGAGFINSWLDPLGILGMFGKSPASIFGLAPNLSSGQSSRRFLGNQVLGNLSSVSTIGPTLNFDPYASGVTSTEKAAAAYPDLFGKAGNAVTAFGAALASAVKSGQSNAKEMNYVISTLIDNFGRAKVSGPDAIIRTAAAFRELHIDEQQAAAAIDQEFQQGKISAEDYQRIVAGLGDVARVSSSQMVSTLRASLSTQGEAIFKRMMSVGVNAFDAVTAAGKDSWLKIAAGMSNDLLPRALQIYELLVSQGVTSAEAIASAFEQAFNFSIPGGLPSSGGWAMGTSGTLVFGTTDQAGKFVPLPSPETTPDQQRQLRGSGLPTIPGFAEGGIVPGPLGMPMLATVHGGETVMPPAQIHEFANIVGAALARNGGSRQQLVVVPVVDRDQLPAALYRLQRENRYILPQTAPDKPVGIR